MAHVESNTPQPRKARRTGGRAARTAQRTHSADNIIAGIHRRIPTYDLLDEDGLTRIEDKADAILAQVGIEFRGDAEALDHWRRAGAEIEGVRVRFPVGMLREILASAPATFVQHARNPQRNVTIGGHRVVFSPAYGSPFVRCLDKGRRYGALKDFHNFVKLAYQSPWLHHSGGTICEPVDIAVNKRHLDMVYAHIRYSDKPFMGSVTAPERAEDSIEMARLVFGDAFVDSHCVILGNINVNSPLVFDGVMTGALRAYARANQCPVVVPFILGGAMGPVTTPGAIAQALAEAMAGCALAQLERPGCPVIFGNFLSSLALRSGSPTFGTPEPALGSLVVGQLARRLNLPLRCSGAFTSAKTTDAQAMQESVMSMLAAVQCGAHFILHAAGWLEGALVMGYEKFVMDADFCGALHTYLGGLAIDDNALGAGSFEDVGPGNHFFGAAHTLANYETAFWDTELSDNTPFEQWRDGGAIEMTERANKKWKAMLAAYEAPQLDDTIDEALRDFMAAKKRATPDQWY